MTSDIYVARHQFNNDKCGAHDFKIISAFKKGDYFSIEHKIDSDWWFGVNQRTQEEGYIPVRYLDLSDNCLDNESYKDEDKKLNVEKVSKILLPQQKSDNHVQMNKELRQEEKIGFRTLKKQTEFARACEERQQRQIKNSDDGMSDSLRVKLTNQLNKIAQFESPDNDEADTPEFLKVKLRAVPKED